MKTETIAYSKEYFLNTQPAAITDTEPVTFLTMCGGNRFFQVVLCIRSILKFHPQAHFIVVVSDKIEDRAALLSFLPEGTDLVEVKDLGIPHLQSFALQYNLFEFCCAVKPYAVDYAIHHAPTDKVIYSDGDFLFLCPATALLKELDSASFLITPHCVRPTQPYNSKNEKSVHFNGIFNAGFMAFNRLNPETAVIGKWWTERILRDGFLDHHNGYNGDQKWLDQWPAIFPGVKVFRDTAYNFAHWNVHERPIDWRQGEPLVDGKPLCAFHISGMDFDLNKPLFKMKLGFGFENNIQMLNREFSAMGQGYREAIAELLSRPGMPGLEHKNVYMRFADGSPITRRHKRWIRSKVIQWPYFDSPLSMTRAQFNRAILPYIARYLGQKVLKEAKRSWGRIKAKIGL